MLVDDPFVGQVFAGRYMIEGFAGQGAMGRVYQARHTRMSKKFAVKIMFGDLTSDATMRARFQAEAEAASRLDHPHVVSVVDFGDTVGGIVYMVMDFVEGQSLSKILETEGALDEVRVRSLMRQIGLGLQHAHDRGLVHRDLKTDNVVVVNIEGAETARIIDFGIAMFSDAAPGPAKLTAVGVVIGTPAYMSPEQACGEKIDHRSDLFSLGIVSYELLAGKKPFDGHPFEIARQNIAAIPPPISDRTPGVVVSAELEAIVFKLMRKPREDRYQTGQALVDAIDAIGAPANDTLGHVEITPRPRGNSARPTLLVQPKFEPKSSPVGKIMFGAAALTLAGVVWWKSAQDGEAIAPAPDPTPTLAGDLTALEPRPIASPVQVLTAAPAATPSPSDEIILEDPDEVDPDEPADPGGARPSKKPRKSPGSHARVTVADDSPIGTSQLTQRFRQVTDLLNQVSKQRGEKFASPYQERFKQTQRVFVQALRDPSKRRQAYDELESLSTELTKLK